MSAILLSIVLAVAAPPAIESPAELLCECAAGDPTDPLSVALGCVRFDDVAVPTESGGARDLAPEPQFASLEVDVFPTVYQSNLPIVGDEPVDAEAPGSSLETPWDYWEERESDYGQWEERESDW